MNPHPFSKGSPDEEALQFLEDLGSGDSMTREAFAAWIRRSPENLGAFLRQRALGAELQGLQFERKPDLEVLIARAKVRSKIVQWPSSGSEAQTGASQLEPNSTRWILHRRAVAAAAGLVALILGAVGYRIWIAPIAPTYTTTLGQQKRVVLADGSVIELNTLTSARVSFSAKVRDVYLLNGEALFNIRHDAARPFRVHVGRTLIEDVGTQFSVRRATDLSTVSLAVLEGSVRVSMDALAPAATASNTSMQTAVISRDEYQPLRPSAQITAGEQVRIVADGALMQRVPANLIQAIAWRHGRLSFNSATLAEIATEFNRYNARRIVVYGDGLQHRRYTGIFDARDPESFIAYLRENKAITVNDGIDSFVVRDR